MKKLFILSFLNMIITPAFAMNAENHTIEISEQCAENIKAINKDGGCLFFYMKGVFNGAAEQANDQHKPSDILTWLASEESNINIATNLKFMPATAYLKNVVSEHYETLDTAFQGELKKTGNVKTTWKWFEDYFKINGLQKPLASYKQKLVDQDIKIRELAKKGIFFKGSTVIINPSREGSTNTGISPEDKWLADHLENVMQNNSSQN